MGNQPDFLDLWDLAARSGREAEFQARLRALRELYAAKVSLLQRLDRAGVRVVLGTA